MLKKVMFFNAAVLATILFASVGYAEKENIIGIGFKGHISGNKMVITGNGVPPSALKEQKDSSRAAQAAAIVDAFRNMGESCDRGKKAMESYKKAKSSPGDVKLYKAYKSVSPLFKKVKTSCSVSGSKDGKSQYERCSFDFGVMKMKSSTDIQKNSVTMDTVSLTAPGIDLKISDFAVTYPVGEEYPEKLSLLAKKLGLKIGLKSLQDGSAEAELTYERAGGAGKRTR